MLKMWWDLKFTLKCDMLATGPDSSGGRASPLREQEVAVSIPGRTIPKALKR